MVSAEYHFWKINAHKKVTKSINRFNKKKSLLKGEIFERMRS